MREEIDLLEKITKNLNSPQRQAIEHIDGPLLILAGAGSGKTRVLTHRMALLIAQGYAAPDEVLCVTFTNKAAKEMESRIYKLLSDLGVGIHEQLWISTFHSFCVRTLRKHIDLLDYKPGFGIYDSGDQLSQIKKVMLALNINDKMYPPKNFQARICNAKMQGVSSQDVEKSKHVVMDPKTLDVYKRYEEEMKRANALDFDDLLLKTYDLFRMYPDILKMYQEKFKYIMVDEYQDTNHIQYLLIQMLAKMHRNLCVVGDEDQSIYSWRGADISNILEFEKDFPEAKVIKLEENYRSSGNIVKAATEMIKNNSQRKEKTLFTSNLEGDKIQVREEKNEYEEARFITKTIQNMISAGEGDPKDYAIFYRTNAQSRVLEESFRTMGLSYKLVGGVRFYDRMEIKDIISYLKLSLNTSDDIALKRVINVPVRGIGKTTMEKVEEAATAQKISFYQAIEQMIANRSFNAGTTGKLRRFLDLINELSSMANQYKLSDFFHIVLDRTEYVQALKKEDSPESLSRVENIDELDNAISQFIKERGEDATLISFLEEMALVSDVDSLDQEQNSITMMTLHVSKGLEYPYVFIVGLEENLFPSKRGDDKEDIDEMEEERRLAYVGITRAEKKLWLTYARERRLWGQQQMNLPSRFIKEIPQELLYFKSAFDFAPQFVNKYRNTQKSTFESQSFPNDEMNDLPEMPESGSFSYSKGMRVRHPTFGVGSIFSLEGSGEALKVSVLFSDNTIKKFVAKYARLEKIYSP